MPRRRGSGKLPPEYRYSDFCGKLKSFGCEIEKARGSHRKAIRIEGNNEKVFTFAVKRGKVKRKYAYMAMEYLGIERDDWMNA